MTINPIRIQFKKACELLDSRPESLPHVEHLDHTFLEYSSYTRLDKLTLEYKMAEQCASIAGRNLNYFGKVAKPKLRQKISEIKEELQLKLLFQDEGE